MSNSSSPVSAGQMSCAVCRLKKVRCDRAKPHCGRCSKLNENCVYPASRQNHIGERKQVHNVESRLTRLENLLIQGFSDNGEHRANSRHGNAMEAGVGTVGIVLTNKADTDPNGLIHHIDDSPSTDLVVELTRVYFARLHQASPMLHQARYMDSLLSPPAAKSPLCLRYIILALAMSTTEAYKDMATPFYQKARRIAESIEMLGQREDFVSLAHAQCWCLISYFEAEQATFTRASISFSRSLRIAQMLELHLLDLGEKVPLGDTVDNADVIELEERRRTWWVIFICDRFICATTGWPAQIDENNITTLLPSSDEAFSMGIKEDTRTLASVLTEQQHNYSSFAGRVLASHIFHRTIQHMQRSLRQEDRDAETESGPYWIQHRSLDNDLVIMTMFLPQNLKLPQAFRCQNAIFVTMTIHAATICLQRAAIWKSQQLMLPKPLILQYKARLLPAAQEIANTMRLTLDLQALFLNPLVLFSLYVAALVFLDDVIADQAHDSELNLDLLLHIMVNAGESNLVAGSIAGALVTEMEQRGFYSSAMAKINNLPLQPQPFPILSEKGAASLHKIFHHQFSPATEMQQPFLSQTDLGIDLVDTADMDLQLHNTCIGEPGCCDTNGGELCGLLAPTNA